MDANCSSSGVLTTLVFPKAHEADEVRKILSTIEIPVLREFLSRS